MNVGIALHVFVEKPELHYETNQPPTKYTITAREGVVQDLLIASQIIELSPN
jgi:hypothetical protein